MERLQETESQESKLPHFTPVHPPYSYHGSHGRDNDFGPFIACLLTILIFFIVVFIIACFCGLDPFEVVIPAA